MSLSVVTIACVVGSLKLLLTGDAVQQNLFQKQRETSITYSSVFILNAKSKKQCLSKCATTGNCKSVIISSGSPRNYINCLITILNDEDLELNYFQINSSYIVWILKSYSNQRSQSLSTTTTAITTTTTTVDTSTVSTNDSTTTEQTPTQGPTVQATGPSGLLNETFLTSSGFFYVFLKVNLLNSDRFEI